MTNEEAIKILKAPFNLDDASRLMSAVLGHPKTGPEPNKDNRDLLCNKSILSEGILPYVNKIESITDLSVVYDAVHSDYANHISFFDTTIIALYTPEGDWGIAIAAVEGYKDLLLTTFKTAPDIAKFLKIVDIEDDYDVDNLRKIFNNGVNANAMAFNYK